MGQKKKITLIIPILIINLNSDGKNVGNTNELPSMSLEASLNAIGAVYSTIPYDNIKDAGKDFPSRIVQFYNQNKGYDQNYEDMVYFPLYIVGLHRVYKAQK